jgi:hypothetical protein
MTTELSAFLVANEDSLMTLIAALSVLGLVGLALFAADGGREILKREEEQDSLDAERGRQLLLQAQLDRRTGGDPSAFNAP